MFVVVLASCSVSVNGDAQLEPDPDDVTIQQVAAALVVDAGLPVSAAGCAARLMAGRFTQDEINELYRAETVADLDPELAADFETIIEECSGP